MSSTSREYNTNGENGRGNPATTVYKLRDADGRVVAEHVREEKSDGSKECRWRLPDGTWGLNGTRLEQLPLYGSEQVSTWPKDDPVILAEGEKACDALDSTDYFFALGTVCGASVVPSTESLEVLRGRIVVLWPDNDKAGRAHMEGIAERLQAIAARVLVYEWRDAPEKGDAADHPIIQTRNRAAMSDLLADLEGAPRWKPKRLPASSFNPTDLGNAERLVAHHGDDLRYCHLWSKWLVWEGKRWAVDDSGEVERRAKETVRAMFHEAGPDNETLAKHALRSNARPRIEAMIALARSEPGIPVAPGDLDADPLLLNVENGTIDLHSGELREHRCEDLITKLAPIEYDREAKAPRFLRFLSEIFDGDEDLSGFVQRFAGYSLTGSTKERAFAILHGRGKNGKSTLIELLQGVMGDYATTTDTETILAKRYQGVSNDVAALKGARFVATAEVEQGRALAESKVKSLTGSDTVTARFLYAEPFSFKPEFKLWLSTNNKPVIKGTDDAIWDRIRLVPFTQRFEGAQADNRLPEKLGAEAAGVLAWMVEGCLQWRQSGLGEPKRVRTATEGYRAEMDTLAGFIDECCIVHPEAWCKFADLYAAYTRWCEESNEQPEKKRRFADSLTERGYVSDNGVKNVAIRRGIALRSDDDPNPSRVNDPTPDPGGSAADNRPSRDQIVNRVNDVGENVNPKNTCKTGISVEGVNEGYREINNFGVMPLVGESLENSLTLVNSLTQEDATDPTEGLTEEQAQRVIEMVRQGESERDAIREVLGDWEVGR